MSIDGRGRSRDRRGAISPRQEKILACYSAGMSRREIAKKLKIRLCSMEISENLISDYFKEYEMTDCANKWQAERGK